MSNTLPPPQLTEEEIEYYETKSADIAKALIGISKVTPVVFIIPKTFERVACYLSEPNFDTKVRVMDKSITTGFYSAGNELREAITLKEHSDHRTYSENPEFDSFKMGVVDHCVTIVKRMENQFKKN